jgi:hypothetical protein
MERISSLIARLKEQFDQGASPSQMLITLQLLQVELSQLQVTGYSRLGTSKVAVMLPQSPSIQMEPPVEELIAKAISSPREEKKQMPQPETVKVKEAVEQRASVNGNSSTNSTNGRKTENPNLLFDPLVDTPTLSQQQEAKEVNQSNGVYSESLNDRLKYGSKEVADVIRQEPIKDLRKAIGINDRFVFINDLFRGDEVMYERSIKTINSFSIFPEAEYWINRELIVKLGWDVENEIVKHFYQLVKRRFSAI